MAEGLFGPTPEEIQSAVRAQGQKLAFDYAQLPAGRVGVAAMANAGQNFGQAAQAALGYQDPAVKRAMLMDDARKEIDGMGIDLVENPEEYTSAVAQALMKRGLHDEALRAVTMGQELMYKKAQMQKEMAEANKKDTQIVDVVVPQPDGGKRIMKATVDKQSGDILSVIGEAESDKQVVTYGGNDFIMDKKTGDITGGTPHVFAPQSSVTVINEAQKVTDKTWSAISEKYITSIQEEAKLSRNAKQQLEGIIQGIKSGQFKGGFASAPREQLGKFLEYTGVDSSVLKGLVGGDVSQKEYVDAMTEQLKNIMAMSRDTGGMKNLPASEYNRLRENLPSMLKTTEGSLAIANILMNDFDRKIASENMVYEEAERRMAETGGTETTDPTMIKRINERMLEEQAKTTDPNLLDKLRIEARRSALAADALPWPGLNKAEHNKIYIDPVDGNPRRFDKNKGLLDIDIKLKKR